jgi:hypothetical protein
MARGKSGTTDGLGSVMLEGGEPVDINATGYADKAPEPVSDIVTLQEADVVIQKDLTTAIPVTVYAHEVPILQAAHGADRVQVVDVRQVKIAGFSVLAEMDRLTRKYKARNDDPLSRAYPLGLRDLVSLTGVQPDDHYQGQQEALVKVRPLPDVRQAA